MLRHTLATLAYRGTKALKEAPEGFASFRVGDSTRTPGEILAHVGDLLDWALWMARGEHRWEPAQPGTWDAGVDRFYAGLDALDSYLASDDALGMSVETLFQGPVADALTHVGQLNLLRRLAGRPVRGENYSKADIVTGNVGRNQPPPRREFD
jgi:hypothetical protein